MNEFIRQKNRMGRLFQRCLSMVLACLSIALMLGESGGVAQAQNVSGGTIPAVFSSDMLYQQARQLYVGTEGTQEGGDGRGSRVVSQREASFAPVYQALEQALRRNDTAHFKLLAKRYLDGGEMPKDIAEATIWLHFAADLGDTSAREQVAVLDAQLAEEQRRMVQFWVRSLKAYQDSIR